MGLLFSKLALFDAWNYGKYTFIFSVIGAFFGPHGIATGGAIGLIVCMALELMETGKKNYLHKNVTNFSCGIHLGGNTSPTCSIAPSACGKIPTRSNVAPNSNEVLQNFYKSDDIQSRWQNYSMNQSMCGPPKFTRNCKDVLENYYKKTDCYPDPCSASGRYIDPCNANQYCSDPCSTNPCSSFPEYSGPSYENTCPSYQKDPDPDFNHLKEYMDSLDCSPKQQPQYYPDESGTNTYSDYDDQCYYRN